MIKRCRFIVALVMCLCVFAYDTVSIFTYGGGGSIAWADGEEPTKPSFSGNALVLTGQLGLYFYLKDVVDGDTTHYGTMSFTIANATNNPTSITYTSESTVTDGGLIETREVSTTSGGTTTKTTYHGFRCDVTSIQMADTITAKYTLTTGDTEIENNSNIKSVADYLTELQTTYSTYTNLLALVGAIQDYGHYAQAALQSTNPTSYGTHTSMAKGSDVEIGTSITDDLSTYEFTNNTGATVYYTLDLDSKTALTVYLPKTLNGAQNATSTVAKKDEETTQDGEITKITKKETYKAAVDTGVTPTEDGEYYALSFTDISAHELDNQYEITVGGNTITIYPLSYVKTVLAATNENPGAAGVDNETQLEHLQRAVVALYNYYKATVAYRADPEKMPE